MCPSLGPIRSVTCVWWLLLSWHMASFVKTVFATATQEATQDKRAWGSDLQLDCIIQYRCQVVPCKPGNDLFGEIGIGSPEVVVFNSLAEIG